jgi:hypothetical protein
MLKTSKTGLETSIMRWAFTGEKMFFGA